MRCCSILIALFPVVLAAAEPSLVPDAPSTVPDYFCTWNVQGFACSYTNASDQADMLIEANLFGAGPQQNWLEFYPEVRSDLTFLLDDAVDFPLGGGHNSSSTMSSTPQCRVGQSGSSENALQRARTEICRGTVQCQETERRPTRIR